MADLGWPSLYSYIFFKEVITPLASMLLGFGGVAWTLSRGAKLAREQSDKEASLARQQAETEAERDRQNHKLEIDHAKNTLKSALRAELSRHKTDFDWTLARLRAENRLCLTKNPSHAVYDAYVHQIGLLSPAVAWSTINAYAGVTGISTLSVYSTLHKDQFYEDTETMSFRLTGDPKKMAEERLITVLNSVEQSLNFLENE